MKNKVTNNGRRYRFLYVLGLVGTALYWGILPEAVCSLLWCKIAIAIVGVMGIMGMIGMCLQEYKEPGYRWVWRILSILGFIGVLIIGWVLSKGISLGWQGEAALLVMMIFGIVGYVGQSIDSYINENKTEKQ